MDSICPVCRKNFLQTRRDKICCSRRCTYVRFNRTRPRKTMKSYDRADALKRIPIPQDQLEIIYGCLLGDSGLIRQTDGFFRMSTTHCKTQHDYLVFKSRLLPSIIMKTEPSRSVTTGREINGRALPDGVQFSTHSISHPSLNQIRPLFYRGKRPFISPSLLKKLTPTSLLIWFLDDGYLDKKSKTVHLSTEAYDVGVQRCLKTWLWHKFQIQSSILTKRCNYMDQNKTYFHIRLTKEGTKKFLNILKSSHLFDHIPDCLSYKLTLP